MQFTFEECTPDLIEVILDLVQSNLGLHQDDSNRKLKGLRNGFFCGKRVREISVR